MKQTSMGKLGMTWHQWNDRRATILARDRNRCVYCGFQGGHDGEELTIDHIIPLSKGGVSKPRNLATACLRCNRIKGDKVPHGIKKKPYRPNGRRTREEYDRVYQTCIAPFIAESSVERREVEKD